MSSDIKKILDQFFNFKVAGKKVTIPYWMNDLKKGIFGPYGGKGTPNEIRQSTLEAARKGKIDLEKATPEQIYLLMKRNRIGLDCSGFAYQVLNLLDRQKGNTGIEDRIFGVGGKGIRKTNARALCGPKNTLPVKNIGQVKPGDLIRLMRGDHVAVVVEADKGKIVYAHISGETKIQGPHLGTIKIVDFGEGLKKQGWNEQTKDGKNYGETYFYPQKGDSLRRLKIWA